MFFLSTNTLRRFLIDNLESSFYNILFIGSVKDAKSLNWELSLVNTKQLIITNKLINNEGYTDNGQNDICD